MAKKPPIDLQAALEAAKAKLGQSSHRAPLQTHAAQRSTQVVSPGKAKPGRVLSNDEGSLTLEKLAKAWAQTKNFPKTH